MFTAAIRLSGGRARPYTFPTDPAYMTLSFNETGVTAGVFHTVGSLRCQIYFTEE